MGRLTAVRDASGRAAVASYSCDPLDRLRVADHGSGGRVRFRYAGLTASAAQEVDDATGAVVRSVGNAWTGEHLEDWAAGGAGLRVYGTNGHGDVTWAAGPDGSVAATARYDPWGGATSVTGSVPDFRFQGSWADDAAGLSWVVTRWYAPGQGAFISEDSLLGQPRDPDSRHLYAYGEGDPVGHWDPDGRWWHRVRAGDTLWGLADRYLRSGLDWAWIFNVNRRLIARKNSYAIQVGWCIWIPESLHSTAGSECIPTRKATQVISDANGLMAARRLGVDVRRLTWEKMIRLTKSNIGRPAHPTIINRMNEATANGVTALLVGLNRIMNGRSGRVLPSIGGMNVVYGAGFLPCEGAAASTIGNWVFVRAASYADDDALMAHEFIHVLQADQWGVAFQLDYVKENHFHDGLTPDQPYEKLAYLWQSYIARYGVAAMGGSARYGDPQPWCPFEPVQPGWYYCP